MDEFVQVEVNQRSVTIQAITDVFLITFETFSLDQFVFITS